MARDQDTADRLRHDIDHGRAGDKVNYPDPAAAPLGTDDEAAGTPPTQEQLRMARAAEIRHHPDDSSSGHSDRTIGARQSTPAHWGWWSYLMIAAVIVSVIMTLLALLAI